MGTLLRVVNFDQNLFANRHSPPPACLTRFGLTINSHSGREEILQRNGRHGETRCQEPQEE